MFNIVEVKEPLFEEKAKVSIVDGKFNLYMPAWFADKRFDYVCKDNVITVALNRTGKRKFSVSKSSAYGSCCPGLIHQGIPFNRAHLIDCVIQKHGDDKYDIILGQFVEKIENQEKHTQVDFDFQGFYRAIDEAGLEPFIHAGEIAFRRKSK